MKVLIKIILITIFMLYSQVGITATIQVPTDKPTIQAGIDEAVDGDVVMVADGVYTGPGNKDIDFKGKKITVKSENGPFLCIIDCEGTGRGFHFQAFETNESVLSGFTIRNGNLDRYYGYGGGIRCSSSAPIITNCIIENCDAQQWGGGVAIMGGAAGAAISIISNSIITNNWAWVGGGGIASGGQGGDVVMVNCTLVGNDCGPDDSSFCTGAAGLGLGTGGSANVANSIFWNTDNNTDKEEIAGNASVTYSLISGGFTGEGNISCDPISCDPGFVAPLTDDYHLMANSPCIDTGNNSASQVPANDIEGNQRVIDGDSDGTATVDMGAHEFFETYVTIYTDIRPKACPNEYSIKGGGSIEVAILGTMHFDVNDIDIASVRLEGVAAVGSSLKDKGTPVIDPVEECECTTEGLDGYIDLCLKFEKISILNALDPVNVDQEYVLILSGVLNNGSAIEGEDCIVFVKKGK